MTDRTVLYLRVSTDNQTNDNQRLQLEALAARRGWTIIKTYEDHAISGEKNGKDRPALEEMLGDARRRRFDRIVAWSIDRMGRSAGHVMLNIAEIGDLGIDQFYHLQGMDTSTAYGKAMAGMAAVFAELELSVMKERIRAGQARARAEGKKFGRPRISDEKKAEILRVWNGPDQPSMDKVVAITGVSKGSVHRILHEAQNTGL